MTVTMEHVRMAVRWAKGEEKRKELEGRKYDQSVIDCGTACCVWGAARLIAGEPALSSELPNAAWKEWKETSMQHFLFASLAGSIHPGVLPLLEQVANSDENLSDLPDVLRYVRYEECLYVLHGSPKVRMTAETTVVVLGTASPLIEIMDEGDKSRIYNRGTGEVTVTTVLD